MPIDPGTISGKMLWLRAKDHTGASGSSVTAWADQSGSSMNATASGCTTVTGVTPSGGRVVRMAGGSIGLPRLGNIFYSTAVTGSSYYSPGYEPQKAADGVTTNTEGWNSASSTGGSPQWLRFQPASSTTATSYKMWPPLNPAKAPSSWTFEGSSDGTSWTTLDTRSSITWAGNTSQTFSFSNSTAYTYYRLSMTGNNGGAETALGELQINSVSNTEIHSPAEMWMVVKSNSTSANAWHFGAGASQNHYTFGAEVYTDFGNVSRRSYVPSASLQSAFRLLRCRIDSSGNLFEWVDEATQLRVGSVTPLWTATPHLGSGWSGDFAEVLLLPPTDSATRAELVAYFNAEHGLTVSDAFYDNFNRANTSTALGVADSGQAWTAHRGTWGIDTNRAYVASGHGSLINVAALDTGSANGTAQVTVAASASTNSTGIAFRVTDASNFYLLESGSAGTTAKFYKIVAGTVTQLANSGTNVLFGAGDVIQVVMSGSGFTFKRNGSTMFTASDSTFLTPTQHGMYLVGVGSDRLDGFSFDPDPGGGGGSHAGAVTLTATSVLTATATLPLQMGTAALTATSTLTASGTLPTQGAAVLSASSTLTATALRTKVASAALAATSVLTADAYIGVPTYTATATLTAHSTLTATAAVNRPAAAALTATSVLTAAAQATLIQAVASLTSTSVLTATPEPPKEHAGNAALYAASALFVEADQVSSATAALTASSSLTVEALAFTPFVEPNDPRTGRPQYRLVIAHRDGERFAELTNATVSAIESGVGVGAAFNFEAPTSDWKLAYVKRAGRQAQVWRGTDLEFRGPIVTIDEAQEGGVTTVKCRDPFWYLESGRRVIGAIPKRDLLVNGSFATGAEPPWQGGFAPDSIPKAQPVRDVVDVDFFGTPMKALQISGVDKVVTVTKELKTAAVFVPNSSSYLAGGEAAIKAVAALMPKTGNLSVRVEGYTADNRINGDPGDGMELSKARADAAAATIRAVRPNAHTTTVGYGYYHQVPGGLDANRRVVVSWSGVQEASGHRQYEVQTLHVTQPVDKKAALPLTFVGWTKITKWLGASKDGWGVYIQVVNPAKPKVIVDSAHADIDEKTPRNRWLRMEATVEVPADGINYEVQVRFYPPAGTALWTRGGLYPGDQLGFFDVDQALIIKGLVEHAQDNSMGKGDLGIGTRCQPTGIVRTREYPYDERMPIDTAINEIATLFRGPEVVMEVTATSQTVVTYHPRQGKRTSEVLVHGGNVVAYEAPTDNREAASSIILQADGFGADREEGYARDWVALDGLMLERVVSTEGDTPVTELEEGAQKALARLKSPQPALWVTIDPARTGEVRDAIGQGDYVRVVIDEAGIDGSYRYVKRRLHPGTDILELMLTPEED